MKVQKVSQSVSSFAGISFVHEEFNNCGLLQLIDQHPGQRNTSETGTNNCSGRGLRYSFAEEKWQKPYWNICDRHRKAYRAAAPDTLLRELKELATEDTIVTSSSGKEYRFNINEKMNDMNIKSLLLTGQLEKGRKDDLDYDNQIIEHEKWDAKRTCKHTTGYFAGIGPTGVYSHPKRGRLQTQISPSFLLSAIHRGESPHSSFCRTTISLLHDVAPILPNDQLQSEKVDRLLKEG
ncbi:MAG TPA: hypothetical protein PLW20_08410 [Paludibacteraceae bacterium]|nr:hypothetical protein [Paludibacteraceae bacterium]